MSYFVTGATGFIGRYLVRALLQRGRSTVYVLVRGRSLGKLDELKEFWGKDAARRVIPVKGDLAQAGLGIGKAGSAQAQGQESRTSSISAPSTTSRPAPRRCTARTSWAPSTRLRSRTPSTPVASTS